MVGSVGSVVPVVMGLAVMGLVGSEEGLVAHLGLWCQCRQLSSSRKNTMILDVHS